MTSPPSSDEQRLEALKLARQRIVELQAVRTYLQEAKSSDGLLSEIEALLTQALESERALTVRRKTKARANTGGCSPLAAALLLLCPWADDAVLALIEFAMNVPALM